MNEGKPANFSIKFVKTPIENFDIKFCKTKIARYYKTMKGSALAPPIIITRVPFAHTSGHIVQNKTILRRCYLRGHFSRLLQLSERLKTTAENKINIRLLAFDLLKRVTISHT